MLRTIRALLPLPALALLAACAAAEPAPARMNIRVAGDCPAGSTAMRRLELLFGLSLRDGRKVTTAEWERFVDSEVTPRFPAGLTVLKGYGQWRNVHGAINRVSTNVLVIWYAPDGESEAKITAIQAAYKSLFTQDSVMRVDGLSCVSF